MKRINKSMLVLLTIVLLFASITPVSMASEKYAPTESSVKLFYMGLGGYNVIETVIDVTVEESKMIERYAIMQLLNTNNIPDNAYSAIPDIKINDVKVKNDTLYIDFDEYFEAKITNNTNAGDMLTSFLSTAFQFENIEYVVFTSNRNKLEIINDSDFSVLFSRKVVKDKTEKEPKTKADEFSILEIPDVPNPVVVIDPGNGGKYYGATYGTIYEKDLNLAVAKKLKALLVGQGATVYMTRETDTELGDTLSSDLMARYTLADDLDADAFISIHFNSIQNTSVNGTTVIYPNNHDISLSKSLADLVHSNVLVQTTLADYRKPYADERNLAVLMYTEMPAIITETGFLSNSTDRAYTTSSAGQDAIAKGIFVGFRKWWWGY